MHIGIGNCASKIKDMAKAGFGFIVFLADWHSWINDKLGGDMEKIRICGEYIKQCYTALGVTQERVEYLWASDITEDVEYWEKVIRIAKSASLRRTWRALPIMGREMSRSNIETAWIYYPCMQAADIFHLELDVACAGIDQRKAHMLARDAAEKLKWKKPIIIHTPLLIGLQGPQTGDKKYDENTDLNIQISSKMSKSIPQSNILVHDDPEDINQKIRNAYCPPKVTIENPVLELAKHIIFAEKDILKISRPIKYGGPEIFENYQNLSSSYEKGKIHPLGLKNGVAESIIEILEPVREHFQRHPKTLDKMKKIEITR